MRFEGDDTVKKTNTIKYLCYFCCFILLLTAIPSLNTANATSAEGMFYFIPVHRGHSFSAYTPHSLSSDKAPTRCMWIQNAEPSSGIDQSKEYTGVEKAGLIVYDNYCTLLKAACDNHLSYCKREVYHLLI